MLRLWVGETTVERESSSAQEMIAVLETQLDDMNPQVVGYLYDELLAVGALDVFTQAVGMKKSRPGILLTVLCPPSQVTRCETILFQETPTLGIRRSLQQRTVLQRQVTIVNTSLGPVRVKVAQYGEHRVNIQPEYEDCAQLARQQHQPLESIRQMALRAYTVQQEA
jgi:pyridinium-3,5-bisthiocarboxylic acid mononucleotide nickel chelatase